MFVSQLKSFQLYWEEMPLMVVKLEFKVNTTYNQSQFLLVHRQTKNFSLYSNDPLTSFSIVFEDQSKYHCPAFLQLCASSPLIFCPFSFFKASFSRLHELARLFNKIPRLRVQPFRLSLFCSLIQEKCQRNHSQNSLIVSFCRVILLHFLDKKHCC